ncbi:hypothetical protein [Conexibacter woesei]|uniref:hypothetical protein n=1 Tax=Conexibacter woesei TaxID=191495 RepID=UPI000479EBA2|nr:hypothetical protein [Conexibacter woesei]
MKHGRSLPTLLAALVLMALTLALAQPQRASAAGSIGVSMNSGDPTEGGAVSITVSGSADSGTDWWAVGTQAGFCAATVDGNAGGYDFTYAHYVSGAFSDSTQFTPPNAGTWTICVYLANSTTAAPSAVGQTTFTVRRATATVNVAISADPTVDQWSTITMSGTSEATRKLRAWITPSSCAATYAGNTDGQTLTYGATTVGPGAYRTSYNFQTGAANSYTVCAYVSDRVNDPPNGSAALAFTVRGPHETMAIGIGADPHEDASLPVTISGAAELDRTLYAAQIAGGPCPAHYSVTAADSSLDYSGRSIKAGNYSESYTYTPPAAGHYRICAWLGKSTSSAELATSVEFDARRSATALSINMDGSPYLLGAGRRTATITGFTEASDYVSMESLAGTTCPPPEFGVDGFGVGGPFSRTIAVDPERSPNYVVCAYLFHDRDVYATARAPISELAVPVPAIGENTPKGMIGERRPSFAWSAGAGFSDDLVLSDRDGATLFVVGSDGAWVPTDDGTPSTGGQQLKTPAAASRKGYERLPGAATYRTAAGRTTVRVTQPLPPGGYRWSVQRRRSDGETARTAPIAFKIAGPDVKRLAVRAKSFPVANSRHPGHSELRITTTPWAYVRIQLTRGGRKQVQNLRWDGSASHALSFTWTCRAGGGAYRYVVTASDDDDHSFTRHGTIRTISRARCASLRAAERRKVDRRVAQRRERQAAAERRREAAARARAQRLVDQCHSIGGVVRNWEWSDGTTWLLCVTPSGAFPM